MYRSIGSKLFDDFGPNREVKVTLYGGLIAEAAFFTPVLGQVCSLVLFVRGLGAVTISILGRGRGGLMPASGCASRGITLIQGVPFNWAKRKSDRNR